MMAIDTEAKRKSAAGLKPFKKILIPDGVLDAADREQIACLYSGILISAIARKIIELTAKLYDQALGISLHEYYNTDDDAGSWVWGTGAGSQWRAQTFTPAIAHTITSVKIKAGRTGLPGTLTISIKATDDNGHPAGADLCSGTIDGDTLPVYPAYEWREITLGAGYELSADIKYAIVVRALSGSDTKYVTWRDDETSPAYTDGNRENSTDGGSTWSTALSADFMFEEWGEGAVKLYGRILTAMLYGRSLTAKLFERSATLKMRTKE